MYVRLLNVYRSATATHSTDECVCSFPETQTNAFWKSKSIVSRRSISKQPAHQGKSSTATPMPDPKPHAIITLHVTTTKTKSPRHTLNVPDTTPPVPRNKQPRHNIASDALLIMNLLGREKFRKMAAEDDSFQLPREQAKGTVLLDCYGCAIGYMERKQHEATLTRPPPGHTYVTDIGGQHPTTPPGFTHYLTVTELPIRFSVTHLLRRHNECKQAFMTIILSMEKYFDRPAARIRSDNANEYLTKTLLVKFGARATAIDLTVPHTQQENREQRRGAAQQKNFPHESEPRYRLLSFLSIFTGLHVCWNV